MSGTIERYAFEDADGAEQGWTTDDPQEAKRHAQQHGLRVIAYQYEFTDSEPVWDFTAREVRS